MRTSGLVVVSAMLVVTHAREVHACGGCFHPEDQPLEQASVVTAHRMALSISNHESVLWDQVQYDGSPEEFVWVLPIKPGARLEVASDAWFEALDAATTTRVSPPTLQRVSGTLPGNSTPDQYEYVYGREDYLGCQVSGPIGLTGCAASDEGEARRVLKERGEEGEPTETVETLAPEAGPVSVVHEGSVGPSPIVSCLMQNGMVRHAYAPSSPLEATATCELGRRHGARVLLPGQPREDAAHVVSCFAEGKCLEEHVGTSLRRVTAKQDCADIHRGRFAEQPCSRKAAVGICHSIIYTREIYYAPAYDQAKARAACNDTGLGDFEAR